MLFNTDKTKTMCTFSTKDLRRRGHFLQTLNDLKRPCEPWSVVLPFLPQHSGHDGQEVLHVLIDLRTLAVTVTLPAAHNTRRVHLRS